MHHGCGLNGGVAPSEHVELPYHIELWAPSERDSVERLLARVGDLELARVLFEMARSEYRDRRITLRRDAEILYDSAC